MKKLFLGLMTVFAFMAFSNFAMATGTTEKTYVQTQNDDEKCGSGKCGEGKCGSGKCASK